MAGRHVHMKFWIEELNGFGVKSGPNGEALDNMDYYDLRAFLLQTEVETGSRTESECVVLMATNNQLLAEHDFVSGEIQRFTDLDDLESRNKLVPRLLELNQSIDWGFKPGEIVERRTEKTWVRDVILGIQENEFTFHSVVMPRQLIRNKTEQLEQLKLF